MTQHTKAFCFGLSALACIVATNGLADTTIFVSDSTNNKIEKFDSSGTDLGTFATTGLNAPTGLAFDSSGNLYVANHGNSTIVKFNSSGTVLATFGSGVLSGPEGLAFDSSGNLYVANPGNNNIQKFNSSGAVIGVFSTDPNNPWGLAFDSSGNLYTGDGNRIGKFNSSGVDLGAFSALPFGNGLAFDSSGNLYVTTGNSVAKLSSSGDVLATYTTGLNGPIGLAFDNRGNLYVANQGNSTIEEFDASGTDLGAFSTGSTTSLYIAITDSINAVPEPSTWQILVVGVAALLSGFRLRRRSS